VEGLKTAGGDLYADATVAQEAAALVEHGLAADAELLA
jgi:hypothetical protein